MAISYHSNRRGFLGFLTYITGSDGVSRGGVIPGTTLVDSSGNELTGQALTGAPIATATTTQVASSASATTILAANSLRKGATVYYDGAAILYLLEGSGTPSSTNYTLKMGQGYYTQYEAPAGFTGAIKGIWSSAVGSANVTERTA